jgi:phosphinothricin acetyltransferase
MSRGHSIRLAVAADSDRLLEIYAPYIRGTAITMETEVPSAEDFRARVERICRQYPYLVYSVDDEIAGYAYAYTHRERAGYRYDVDISIYLSPKYQRLGIGGELYARLFALLEKQGYYNAYAGCNAKNVISANFHYKQGFAYIGTFPNAGFKFGHWFDVSWYGKAIREPETPPAVIKPIHEISPKWLDKVLSSC